MKHTALLALGLGILLLGGIVAGVVVFAYDTDQNARALIRLDQASRQLDLLFSAVQDVETGQRGYLLTRNVAYLSPYSAALQEMPDRMAALAAVLADDPDQQKDFAALKALITEKLAELKMTIDLLNGGRTDDAIATVSGDIGRRIMDKIRTLVSEMRDRQVTWLEATAANIERGGRRLEVGVASVAFGVAMLGIYAFAAKRRQRLIVERHARAVEEHSNTLEEANRQLTNAIRSREEAEAQVRQMQKIEAIGQLTGGLAHDFNNMLAIVLSALSLARRRLGASAIDKYLDAATDAANRAAGLTRRLLAFSRQQPLAPEPIDANKMVSDMSELLRRTLGETIVLETVLAGGLWRINADAVQLENSIVNLAVNARDAMPEGGRITIETANVHLDEQYAALNAGSAPGQYVMVAVTDSGSGMTPDVIAKAFDPFFTTKPVGRGTGLGLSQVHGFVNQSKGHIKLYSELGHGTTIKLYLPRYFAKGDAATAKAPEHRLPAAVSAQTVILLVEDDKGVRTLSADALQEIGFRVVVADGGKAALQLLEEHPDVALLFTDIMMPEMNGRALAELALKMRPDLKVLYTTGFTRNAVVHNSILDHGVNFIAKPFTIEELAIKLQAVLGS
jgi:signal transduction histidine kinase